MAESIHAQVNALPGIPPIPVYRAPFNKVYEELKIKAKEIQDKAASAQQAFMNRPEIQQLMQTTFSLADLEQNYNIYVGMLEQQLNDVPDIPGYFNKSTEIKKLRDMGWTEINQRIPQNIQEINLLMLIKAAKGQVGITGGGFFGSNNEKTSAVDPRITQCIKQKHDEYSKKIEEIDQLYSHIPGATQQQHDEKTKLTNKYNVEKQNCSNQLGGRKTRRRTRRTRKARRKTNKRKTRKTRHRAKRTRKSKRKTRKTRRRAKRKTRKGKRKTNKRRKTKRRTRRTKSQSF